MTSRRRCLVSTLWLLFALGGVLTGQTPSRAGPTALRLHVVRESGRVNAVSVLVRQEATEGEVVMYFLTAGHLFKNEYGNPLPDAVSVTLEIGGGRTVEVPPQNIHLPRGNTVDVAVLKVTTSSSLLVTPVLTLTVPPAGSSFSVSGFDSGGRPLQVDQRVRRVATLIVRGDRAMPLIDGCAGAAAASERGVFGIVSSCEPNQLPTIVPFSAVADWIEHCVPGGLTLPRPVQ
jgi:hypothetical protein